MPIYGYRCQSCGHELDALQKMSDDPLKDCPACGQPELKRQLSAPRFRLKGGGWYETDFKTDNKRNLADGKSDSGDASGGKKDSGSDSKKPADTSTKKASA
ncbi:MAG: zinc ribbon domain-containing protein [Pseudomonadota bacterium]